MNLTTPQKVAGASIMVTAIAAFLPWASIFGLSVRGIEGDGQITLACAIVGGALLALRAGLIGSKALGNKAYYIPSFIAAVIVALIGVGDMNGVAAIGLYLTLFAGIAWVAALVWDRSLAKKSAVEVPAASEGNAAP